MSTKSSKKDFDTIAYTRKVRAELGAKLAKMTPEEQSEYWRTMTFEDPFFQYWHEHGPRPDPPPPYGVDPVESWRAGCKKVKIDA